MLEIPRLKTVWKALTKKRSLVKATKSRELKVKTELLWADNVLRGMDIPRWREEAGVVSVVGLLVRTGAQTAEAFPLGERGASLVMGQCRRIPLAIKVEWVEQEYQYITSFVERANSLAPPARAGVTIRQSISKLTRRTWRPAQYRSDRRYAYSKVFCPICVSHTYRQVIILAWR